MTPEEIAKMITDDPNVLNEAGEQPELEPQLSTERGGAGGWGVKDCHYCGHSPLYYTDGPNKGKQFNFCVMCGHRVGPGGNKCEACQGFEPI